MQGTARLLALLLVAVAFTLPARMEAELSSDLQIETSVAHNEFATSLYAPAVARACHGCKVPACKAYLIWCCTSCLAGYAINPDIPIVATQISEMDPGTIPAAGGQRGSPKPHPPRPIGMS